MKPFFSPGDTALARRRSEARGASPVTIPSRPGPAYRARLAAYDDPAAAPRVYDVTASSPGDLIEQVSARAYSLARETGGFIPYTVIREIVENLVHADFREPVISILPGGSEIRFADQGPGIPDKERAVLPGYTTATQDMKDLIRGVGSGLPLVREFLRHSGGSLELSDNLVRGTLVTLRAGRTPEPSTPAASPDMASPPKPVQESFSLDLRLSDRHKKVLSLILECGDAGPTLVSRELGVGLSTAHRDLAFLEEQGLISSDDSGKRTLTDAGESFMDTLFS